VKPKILIVEDEYIVQLDLECRLQALGYSVVGLASRGEEAIEKAAELAPDLVLMDVHLAGSMDGIEAAQRIKSVRQIPVVYVTAYAGTTTRTSNALRPSLSKPVQTRQLQQAIAQALACAGQQDGGSSANSPSTGT
jgi:CheY-like chemotaxis protein